MSENSHQKGLIIRPITNGTVIDHITAGEALNVLKILGITGTTTESISVATNVTSPRIGRKDIVKIENRELRQDEVDRIALIAPQATINIIRECAVHNKKGVTIPPLLKGVIRCPNPGCISNTKEPIISSFEVTRKGLQCTYCDWLITKDIANYLIGDSNILKKEE